jgi:hypothetical protein
MHKRKAIGSCVALACENLLSVKKLGPDDRVAINAMVYIAENLLSAIMMSEDIDVSMVRRRHGNHQIDSMIDCLPDECSIKVEFLNLSELTIYATTFRYPTPSGRIPEMPKPEEAQAYFDTLFSILEKVTRHFQVNPRLSEPVAGIVSPLREDSPEPE